MLGGGAAASLGGAVAAAHIADPPFHKTPLCGAPTLQASGTAASRAKLADLDAGVGARHNPAACRAAALQLHPGSTAGSACGTPGIEGGLGVHDRPVPVCLPEIGAHAMSSQAMIGAGSLILQTELAALRVKLHM